MNGPVNVTTTEASNATSDFVLCRNIVMSADTRQLVEAVLYGGLTTLLCLIGIPTNVINCVVFWRQGLKDRMNLCLFCLALADCSYLCCAFVMYSVSSFIVFRDQMSGDEYGTKVTAALFGVYCALKSFSRFIGVVIAVERCVCVVVPLTASTIMRTSSMAVAIVVSLLFFQGCYALQPLSFQAVKVEIAGRTVWLFLPTKFHTENKKFVDILSYTVLGFVIPVSTFFVVTMATTVTVLKLRAAMAWRQRTSSTTSDSANKQEALTVMLVIVSGIHIVTMAPSVAWELTLYFLTDLFSREPFFELFKALSAIGNAVPQINSSVNFFIYYSRSSRFRAIVHHVFDIRKPLSANLTGSKVQ